MVKRGAETSEGLANLPAALQDSPFFGGLLQAQSLRQVIDNYIQYYAASDSHTARAKRYDLQHFLMFLAGSEARQDQIPVSEWTWQRTQQFIDSRFQIGEAPATVGRRLATLKHLGRTLAERVPGFINPAREVKGPVQQQTRPHGLLPDQIDALREAAEPKELNFVEIRNQFLLELLLATGLRADEVRLLTMGQVSDDLNWLKNVKTKGRKFRNVYLDSNIRKLFVGYLAFREDELKQRFHDLDLLTKTDRARLPVLVSLYRADLSRPESFGLSPKSIWRIIATFGRRAQSRVDDQVGNLHPHRLRHTFAHGLLDSSKDIRLVAQALGHSDVRTTMRYTERTEEEIARAIEARLADDS